MKIISLYEYLNSNVKNKYTSMLHVLEQLTDAPDVEGFIQTVNNMVWPPYYVYMAVQDNKLAGMATLFVEQKLVHGCGKAGHIEDVSVDSRFRRLSVGSMLIQKLLEVAKIYGCYKVVLDCEEDIATFYEKNGFTKSGVFMRKYL